MAIEKTVMTPQKICRLIKEKYGIDKVSSIHILDGTSANCFLITSEDGKFVLKEFQGKYTAEYMEFEPLLNVFLRRKGIAVADFIKTNNGKYAWQYNKHAFHLQRFVEGSIFEMNTAPEWLLEQSAKLLGKMHKEMKFFPKMKNAFEPDWFTKWNVFSSEQAYRDLINVSSNIEIEEIRQRIISDLNYKLELQDKLVPLKNKFANLVKCNSHGDYSIMQMICGKDNINAVIDFSDASNIPAVWEIIRSYTYAAPECAKGKSIDIKRLRKYIECYKQENDIPQIDLRMMPYLYLFQLGRSRFGYTEYLITKSENRDKLINFAMWRTNMCKFLENNIEEISHEVSIY